MAPQRRGRADHSPVVADRRSAILAQKDGSIEVHHVAELTEQAGRGHGQRRAEHVADHDGKSQPARFACHGEPFREAAALVQFDVDHVVSAYELRNVREPLDAFIRGEPDRRTQAIQLGVLSDSERLLDQLHAIVDQHGQQCFERGAREALIGIHPEPGGGETSRTAHTRSASIGCPVSLSLRALAPV